MLRKMTVERVMFAALWLALALILAYPPTDTDLWWHLRSGEQTLQTGIVRSDMFSHTLNGQVWVNHSWGAQVILYGVYSLLGSWGLYLYTATLAIGGMAWVYKASDGNTYLRAFVVLLAASVATLFWSPRPQMISFFLSSWVIFLLYEAKRTQSLKGLRFFPLLMLAWVNLHAGFAIGFILLGGFIAGEIVAKFVNRQGEGLFSWQQIRNLILIGFAGAAVLILNPHTFRIYLIPFQTFGLNVLHQYIQEWQPPDLSSNQLIPFLVLWFMLIGVLGASRQRLHWSTWILLTGTGYLALTSARNLSLFAVVVAPPLSWHLTQVLNENGFRLRPIRTVSPFMGRVNLLLVILMVLGVSVRVVSVLLPDHVREMQTAVLPVDAVAYLQDEQPDGLLFNTYNWGGYLIYALPDYPVFVDGRTDMYGDDFLTAYLQTYLGEDSWQDTFAAYDIGLVLVELDAPIANVLAEESDWVELYTDELAVIYQRVE